MAGFGGVGWKLYLLGCSLGRHIDILCNLLSLLLKYTGMKMKGRERNRRLKQKKSSTAHA